MYPELLVINFRDFHWIIKSYSFFYFLAVVVVVWGIFFLSSENGFRKKDLIIFLLVTCGSGFFGARLMHFLTNREAYLLEKYNIFSLDMEGFAIAGGIMGAVLSGFWICKKLKIDYWKLGDISVIFLGFGIALARIGCFLNGCCFGKKTSLPWGVNFPELSQAHQYQLSHGMGSFFGVSAVHPTQIYEALAAIIGSLMAIYFLKKKFTKGIAILFFGIWFASFRLFNMQLRVMPITLDVHPFFYPIFYMSVIIICIGLICEKLKNKSDKLK
jgi:phosphatidylglycerol:prolipoprotein diacylglycerol transferase